VKTLNAEDDSDRGDTVANEGGIAINAIVVSEWGAEVFHRRVSDLELQGYIARRETYRVIPEMNPETGRIIHLHMVEMYRLGSDEGESRRSSEPADQR
jgi:hypothetical protein